MDRKRVLKFAGFGAWGVAVGTWGVFVVLAGTARADEVSFAVEETTEFVDSMADEPVLVSRPVQTSPNGKQSRFGAVVSEQAKVFRESPFPGFRNFGEWVSSQRRHPKRPKGDEPTGGSDSTPRGPELVSTKPKGPKGFDSPRGPNSGSDSVGGPVPEMGT